MEPVCWAVTAYLIICVLRIIFSWIPVNDPGSIFGTISTTSYHLTEPVFASIRKVLPRPGDLPLDLSPVVVILVLTFLQRIFC